MKTKYNTYILFIILIVLMCIGKSVNGQTVKQIQGYGIQHPEVVYKQMMLETGNLKCTNCSLDYNNYFGFHNGKRYLIYDNLEHCLENYKLWQDWRCPDCETKDEYYKCLIKYWGAPQMNDYINKLKQIQCK